MMRTKREIELQLAETLQSIGKLAAKRSQLDARTHEYRTIGKQITQLVGWQKALTWVLDKRGSNKP